MLNNALTLKRMVCRNFNRAAAIYDQKATVQAQVGERLLSHLPLLWKPKSMLDLGAGTGNFSIELVARYPEAHIISLDRAEAMSKQAKLKVSQVLTADFDVIPIQNQSMSGVFSNLALQWSHDINITMQEIKRVLQDKGLLIFSTLGPNTFNELRQSHFQTQHFLEKDKLFACLLALGFTDIELKTEQVLVKGENLLQLMRDVKAIGANSVNLRNSGLLGRRRYQDFLSSVPSDANGEFSLSYEVIYGKAIVRHRN